MTGLPDGISLRVWDGPPGGTLVFESRGKWLHPLFDLADFLGGRPDLDPGRLTVRDRVVGRAAAFLMVRLGLRQLETDVVSDRALGVLEDHGIRWCAGQTVGKIGCQTEDLLVSVRDPGLAWELLSQRRLKALGRA